MILNIAPIFATVGVMKVVIAPCRLLQACRSCCIRVYDLLVLPSDGYPCIRRLSDRCAVQGHNFRNLRPKITQINSSFGTASPNLPFVREWLPNDPSDCKVSVSKCILRLSFHGRVAWSSRLSSGTRGYEMGI